ncbi:hypothetical protein KP77_24150 [Jeotgalibacillus alimentarius]|uniref:Uncharacterized protein n=1 Tax=Jeotgalibacillus alimentarius TaxID=135826 RepID=A0A0C2RAH3_9BACL|nr:hypothetical protein KP77_24150 [Jeotgalibacillus alimentarius]
MNYSIKKHSIYLMKSKVNAAEGGDSGTISGTAETPQAKPRRLSDRRPESTAWSAVNRLS